jgi:hypothetical protein
MLQHNGGWQKFNAAGRDLRMLPLQERCPVIVANSEMVNKVHVNVIKIEKL